MSEEIGLRELLKDRAARRKLELSRAKTITEILAVGEKWRNMRYE